MFRMYGNIVELYRYKITYETTESVVNDDGEMAEQPVPITEYCISDEHRDDFIKTLGDTHYTVEAIDQTGNEWLNGKEFESYDTALKALEAGEAAYKQTLDPITELQLAVIELYEEVLNRG